MHTVPFLFYNYLIIGSNTFKELFITAGLLCGILITCHFRTVLKQSVKELPDSPDSSVQAWTALPAVKYLRLNNQPFLLPYPCRVSGFLPPLYFPQHCQGYLWNAPADSGMRQAQNAVQIPVPVQAKRAQWRYLPDLLCAHPLCPHRGSLRPWRQCKP